jgi:bifunctional UDP-N-acetylglucosamine pyrophosphorylase / glucosamine-1-phosphate N-acetyltransferase
MRLSTILLAAGEGTRMRSRLPKVLHPLAGKPLILHALGAISGLSDDLPVVVVGPDAEALRSVVGAGARYAVQAEPRGTAHAVQSARELVAGQADLVLVTYADMPLIRPESVVKLVELQKANAGPMTILTVALNESHGFGRVIRAADGRVEAVVEEADATPEQMKVREYNACVTCFNAAWLWPALERVRPSAKGETYLTDLVALAAADGLEVRSLCCEDPDEAIGINNRVHLAEAEAIYRRRTNTRWMLEGVTIVDPETTFIEPDVTIGQDSVIWPNTYLRGSTHIGENCAIGPDSIIESSQIGNNCRVLASYLESSTLEDDVRMGPFCHLRPKAYLAKGVKMGNFGEVKGSYLGQGVHMGHFSYIGDATIGAHTNIGAGTITCNFDGKNKFKTEIGEEAFIGSDTMLIAPLKIGRRAKTGAGAVVTHDVPDDSVVVGVPARPLKKE